MKIKLTKKEKNDLLKEVLTGTIDTDHFKNLFSNDREQPIFAIITDEKLQKLSEETKQKIIAELKGLGVDLFEGLHK